MSAAYKVLLNRDLLAYIADYHTNLSALFINYGKTTGLRRRINDLTISSESFKAAGRLGDIGALKLLCTQCAPISTMQETLTKVVSSAAKSGQLSIIKWIYENVGAKAVDTWDVIKAAKHGHVHVLEWLHRIYNVEYNYEVLAEVATRGHLHVLKWLYSHGARDFTEAAMDAAAENGHFKVVEWLRYKLKLGYDEALQMAAKNGHLKIVRFIYYRCKTRFRKARAVMGAIRLAIIYGRFSVVKFLCRIFKPKSGEKISIDCAAENGHLRIIIWLHKNLDKNTISASSSAMDNAAENGHFYVLRWLHHNRAEGCTTWAMDGAAQNGHFRIVRWLHHNRAEGCTTRALDLAARNCHSRVVRWLSANRKEGCTYDLLEHAATNGDLGLVKLFYKKYAHDLEDDDSLESEETAMAYAARNGHLHILKWVHNTYPKDRCRKYEMRNAAENGHLHVIKWLFHTCRQPCDVHVVSRAVENGHLNIVKWIYNTVGGHVTSVPIIQDYAIMEGHLHILEWLQSTGCLAKFPHCAATTIPMHSGSMGLLKWLQRNHDSCLRPLVVCAAKDAVYYGHLHIVKWLYKHYKEIIDPNVTSIMWNAGDMGQTHVIEWLSYASGQEYRL